MNKFLKWSAIALLLICVLGSWGVLLGVYRLDARVDKLRAEVLDLRKGVTDKTQEAEELQRKTLERLGREYKLHMEGIRNEVNSKMLLLEQRNDQAIDHLRDSLAKFDASLERLRRQTEAPPASDGS